MNIIYNCFAGISGDMNLAAMIDLGMHTEVLKSELSKLGLDAEYTLEIEKAQKHGIWGTQVTVVLKHQHHHHEHVNDKEHHHHHSRNYADISEIINESALAIEIKTIALKIFWEVAKAEGKVHNQLPEEVHFHEVGATDSIVDIVGAAICYYHLEVEHVMSTTPELGGGFIHCQHGKMPVPAPATAEILKGISCTTGAVCKEMTTPTGAAILKVLTNEFVQSPPLNVTKTAYGIGHRDVEIPNVLRVYEHERAINYMRKQSIMIQCNIDDMTAEELAPVAPQLIKMGAQDAFLTPIVMKKGRVASMLSVLCNEEQLAIMEEQIFNFTSTVGLRYHAVNKIELPREHKTLDSPWGVMRYKQCQLPNGKLRRKFEHDDLVQVSQAENMSIAEVRNQLHILLGQ